MATGGVQWRALRAAVLAIAALAGAALLAHAQPERTAVLLKLDGPVSPATADYVVRGIDEAAERGAALVILQMDTPGGLDTSMRDIIRAILGSSVPVAGYVAPAGARAASAGTYIMYAAHVAAMVPGTNLGAATPIQLGGGGLPFGGGDEQEDGKDGKPADGEGAEAPAPQNAHEAKAVNDAVAYIRGLAELRGRNAEWAERAVRQAASLTATRAAEEKVIDFTAPTLEALLQQADGMTVRVGQQDVRLETAGLTVEAVEPDWRTRLLGIITNPNVALILMMIGIYGLIFEFINPGTMVPGTIGGISLILGLYSLAILPVTFAGLGLLVLGLALLVAEAFAPSFGILGLGGAAAFVLGALILFDPDVPGLAVSWPLVAGIGVAGLLLSLLVASLVVSARRRPVASGSEQMVGMTAEVLSWSGTSGYVRVHGERWKAVGERRFRRGEKVQVAGIEGLTLHVVSRKDAKSESR